VMNKVVRPVITIISVIIFVISLWSLIRFPFKEYGFIFRIESAASLTDRPSGKDFAGRVKGLSSLPQTRLYLEDYTTEDDDVVATFRFKGKAPDEKEKARLKDAVIAFADTIHDIRAAFDKAWAGVKKPPAPDGALIEKWRSSLTAVVPSGPGNYWKAQYLAAYTEFALYDKAEEAGRMYIQLLDILNSNEFRDLAGLTGEETDYEQLKKDLTEIAATRDEFSRKLAALEPYIDEDPAFTGRIERIRSEVGKAAGSHTSIQGTIDRLKKISSIKLQVVDSDAPVKWVFGIRPLISVLGALLAIALLGAGFFLLPKGKPVVSVRDAREVLGLPVIGAVSKLPHADET